MKKYDHKRDRARLGSCAIGFAFLTGLGSVSASTVYTDFTPRNTATATTSDFYNQTVEGTNGQDDGTAGFPFTVTDATEIDGTTGTTIDVSLSFYNNGPGQTRFFNSTNVFADVDVPAGFEVYAVDGYLVNNHNSNGPVAASGKEFGYILTYSDLDPTKSYDISVWGKTGGNVANANWSITTGTGDADVIALVNNTDTIMDWTSVTPDLNGDIVLTNVTNASGTFGSTSVAFTSISLVPEPSSAALLGLGGLGLLVRRRRA